MKKEKKCIHCGSKRDLKEISNGFICKKCYRLRFDIIDASLDTDRTSLFTLICDKQIKINDYIDIRDSIGE